MDRKIVFQKPFKFEEKEYTEVDLSGLENLTTRDLVDTEKMYASYGQNNSPVKEMSVGYACIIASKATNLPIEFFEYLPANEGIQVKNEVVSFFYN